MLACRLFPLVPGLLLLQLGMQPVLARHSECSWKPTPGAPAPLGYRPYCSAKLINARDYQCHDKVGVVDFGKKSGGVLEWHSPCGSEGGYAKSPDGSCPSPHFALCVPDSPSVDCYFMASQDDCQWPYTFSKAPQYVDLWIE